MRRDFFDIIMKNWERKKELDSSLKDSLATINDEVLQLRAYELKKQYVENNELISDLENTIKNSKSNSQSEDYFKFLYDGVMNMYLNDYDDLHIMSLLLDYLIEYYKDKNDKVILLDLHAVRFYQNLEVVNRYTGSIEADELLRDFSVIVGFRNAYQELPIESRRTIFATYYNVCVVCLDTGKISLDTSCTYLREMVDFWNSPLVQSVDKSDEKIIGLVDATLKEWLAYYRLLSDASEETRNYFFSLAERKYADEKNAGKEDYQITCDVFSGYIATLTMKHKITPLEGFSTLSEHYVTHRNFMRDNHEENDKKLAEISFDYFDYMFFFLNAPMHLYDWISDYDIPNEVYLPFVRIVLKDLLKVWPELYDNLPGPFLDWYVIRFYLSFLALEEDEKIQMEWLEKFLVKRDVTTYIHSSMVSELAFALAEDMLENSPEIFEGTWNYTTDDVIKNRKHILDYIKVAAFFHDIGKTRIGNVIDTQTRKIDELEFSIIKSHPSEGAELLDKVPLLLPYRDVIIGHHRSYDGKNGYPDSFDNTKSEVRTVIDLVTICDCIDAATDNYGRNYTNGKNADCVIEEIYEGRGRRYNPQIAEYLHSSETLREKIGHLTTVRRNEKYQTILHER